MGRRGIGSLSVVDAERNAAPEDDVEHEELKELRRKLAGLEQAE
jgi:hypothetical protein